MDITMGDAKSGSLIANVKGPWQRNAILIFFFFVARFSL
jgi:hypothetical protein